MSLVCIQSLIFWYPLKYCSVQYKAYTTEQNNYLWFIRSTELKGSLLLGYFTHWRGVWVYTKKTLPKAQRTRGLSSYHKFLHKSWSKFNLKISTKHQQLHKTLTSKSWPNLDSECRPRFNFITSTKHQQQNVDQNSAQKSRRNFNFKILT